MYYFEAVVIVLACFRVTNGYRDCRVRNFPIVENFDMKRDLGLWYPQEVTLFPGQPDELRLRQPSELATALTPTIMSTYVIGRQPLSGECLEELLICRLIDPPRAVFNITFITAPEPQTSTFVIVDTDYTGFQVYYGCFEERPDGTCNVPFVITETRTPRKTTSDAKNLGRVLDTLCIDRSILISLREGKQFVGNIYQQTADLNITNQTGDACPRPRQQQCPAKKKYVYGRKF